MGRKPKDWHSMFQRQLDTLSDYGLESATAVVNFSLMNNYQGLLTPTKIGVRQKAEKPQQQFKDFTNEL